MATTTRDVLIDIITRGDSTGAQNIGKSLDEVAAKATAAGKTLSLTLTTPLAGLAAVGVTLAADAAESAAKLEAVYGDATENVNRRIQELRDTIPGTTAQLQDLFSGIQDLLEPLGLAPEAAAQMSDSVVTLAADLASFNNIPIDEALERIRSGLIGQYEPLLKFGVALNATTVKAKAFEQGIGDGKRELTAAERAQVSYQLILAGTTKAHGDAAKTAGEASNQLKFLKAETSELFTVIGNQLLPSVIPLVSGLKAAAAAGQQLPPTLINIGIAAGTMAAALGPGLLAAGSLIRSYRILQTVAPQTAAAIRAVGSATLSATPIITAAAVAYWGISEAAQAAKTANANFRESIGLGDTSYVDAILGANSQSELDSAIAQTQVKLDGLSAVIEQQKQQIEDTKGFKFFESGIANTAIRAELEEELALMEKQAQEMAGYIALGNERGAQIVTENATRAETAALIEQERIAAEQKAIAEAEAAAQLAAQKAARETLLENLDLEEEILLAKIAGNDELLQSLQDQKREQVIINQLTKTGVSEEAAIARAERLVKLQNQAAEAESKRRKNTSTGNDGNDDLRTRIGLLDQVATKEQSGQQLRDGVRAEQYTDAGGRRKTRYFEGGRLLGDSDQYGHVGDPQPSSAAITPSLSANNPPLASSAQPSSLNNQSSSFSPQSSTLDTTSIEQAITTMHTRLQEQLNNLASRINQLGN
jgi:hypothetical protein